MRVSFFKKKHDKKNMIKKIPEKVFERWQRLVDEIVKHDRLYYQDNAPILSDQEYDLLRKELLALEAAYAFSDLKCSPTQTIGYASEKSKITHLFPVYSLDNLVSWPLFTKKIQRFLGLDPQENVPWVCEPKIDGLTLILRYEKGHLMSAATRGNGYQGEDVTGQLSLFTDIPKILKGGPWPDIMEIRAEAFMSIEDFKGLNDQRREQGLSLFANARNAAVGSLRTLEEQKNRFLQCLIHGFCIPNSPFHTYTETMTWLGQGGLPVQPLAACVESVKACEAYFQDLEKNRSLLPYEADGVVFKLNDLGLQARLGHSSRAPRYAIAQKFLAAEAWSQILDITFQVGRTGILTPVAHLKRVFVGGVWIERASLHNHEDLERKDIRLHDWVAVKRAGDVIPYLSRVDLSRRSSESRPLVFPTVCPSCGQPLSQKELRCENRKGCLEQKLWSLRHFVSSGAFDLTGVGLRRLEQLYEKGMIDTPADLFTLTPEPLMALPGWGERLVGHFMDILAQRRVIPLHRFIYALGIDHVGQATAHLLAHAVENIDGFLDLIKGNFEEKIQSIGPIVLSSIKKYGENDLNFIEKLISFVSVIPHAPLKGHLSGKTVVFTGTFHTMTRAEAKAQATRAGARVLSQPSLKTDYLVIGKDAGKKADAPGVKQRLSEAEWKTLLQEDSRFLKSRQDL